MIIISRYFPAYLKVSDSNRMRTTCATPNDAFNSECYRGRVGNHRLEYWYGDKVTRDMIFFDSNHYPSIIVQADTVHEVIAFIKLANIEEGIW